MAPHFSATLTEVNSAARIYLVSATLPNGDVATIDQIYRDNLKLLIAEVGGNQPLADLMGCSASQISQWLNASKDSKTGKPRSMSRATARKLEKVTGKEEGWMDQPHGETIAVAVPAERTEKGAVFHSISPAEWEMLDNWRHMSDSDREAMTPVIAEKAETFQENVRKAVALHQIRLPVEVARAARAAGKAARTAVLPRQAQLNLDDPKSGDSK